MSHVFFKFVSDDRFPLCWRWIGSTLDGKITMFPKTKSIEISNLAQIYDVFKHIMIWNFYQYGYIYKVKPEYFPYNFDTPFPYGVYKLCQNVWYDLNIDLLCLMDMHVATGNAVYGTPPITSSDKLWTWSHIKSLIFCNRLK